MDSGRPADLHVHTVYSDGDLTPEAVVRGAAAAGLAALAVTDHDTVQGVGPVTEAARGTGVEILAGVELSALEDGFEIHILGYLVDVEDPELGAALAFFRRDRADRARRMVERLREIGVPARLDRVLRIAGDGSVGRPHVAQALLEDGLVGSFGEAFARYIGYDGPAYVPKVRLDPGDAIGLIRRAGGVAALAHPGPLGRDDILPRLVSLGLGAIEVWHPRHRSVQSEAYHRFALEHDLVPTGGSDAHGSRTGFPDFAGPTVPYAAVEALRAKAARGGLA